MLLDSEDEDESPGSPPVIRAVVKAEFSTEDARPGIEDVTYVLLQLKSVGWVGEAQGLSAALAGNSVIELKLLCNSLHEHTGREQRNATFVNIYESLHKMRRAIGSVFIEGCVSSIETGERPFHLQGILFSVISRMRYVFNLMKRGVADGDIVEYSHKMGDELRTSWTMRELLYDVVIPYVRDKLQFMCSSMGGIFTSEPEHLIPCMARHVERLLAPCSEHGEVDESHLRLSILMKGSDRTVQWVRQLWPNSEHRRRFFAAMYAFECLRAVREEFLAQDPDDLQIVDEIFLQN